MISNLVSFNQCLYPSKANLLAKSSLFPMSYLFSVGGNVRGEKSTKFKFSACVNWLRKNGNNWDIYFCFWGQAELL